MHCYCRKQHKNIKDSRIIEQNLVLSVPLQFLQFFTSVSWGISPAQILLIVQKTAIFHSIFISPLFLSFFNLEFRNRLLSVSSVLYCILFCSLSFFHSILFYSSFYPLLCFLPLFIHFIFWSALWFSFQISYPFFSLVLLLYFVCFSLILNYYSICFLSISLHPFRSLYLILLCYLFCSCFCFLYTSYFW